MLKQDFDSLLPALKAVYAGQNVFGNEIITKLPNLLGRTGKAKMIRQYGISDKELEIIKKIAEGLSNREIAEQLFLSEGTIRNNISTILDKLNLRDRTQLAIFYYKNIK